mmetsp:Transcript_16969/g.26131  ORF Transcript_16969/g.26131 Transcript_16969/m.26131 type:complete len:103 (-) Transcript_16969:1430-1738(-)
MRTLYSHISSAITDQIKIQPRDQEVLADYSNYVANNFKGRNQEKMDNLKLVYQALKRLNSSFIDNKHSTRFVDEQNQLFKDIIKVASKNLARCLQEQLTLRG